MPTDEITQTEKPEKEGFYDNIDYTSSYFMRGKNAGNTNPLLDYLKELNASKTGQGKGTGIPESEIFPDRELTRDRVSMEGFGNVPIFGTSTSLFPVGLMMEQQKKAREERLQNMMYQKNPLADIPFSQIIGKNEPQFLNMQMQAYQKLYDDLSSSLDGKGYNPKEKHEIMLNSMELRKQMMQFNNISTMWNQTMDRAGQILSDPDGKQKYSQEEWDAAQNFVDSVSMADLNPDSIHKTQLKLKNVMDMADASRDIVNEQNYLENQKLHKSQQKQDIRMK